MSPIAPRVPDASDFVYLGAVIARHSCYVLAWELSNTLEAAIGARVVRRAIKARGVSEVFNSDQRCQFTLGLLALGERLRLSLEHEGVYLKRGEAVVTDSTGGRCAGMDLYNTYGNHFIKLTLPDSVSAKAGHNSRKSQMPRLVDRILGIHGEIRVPGNRSTSSRSRLRATTRDEPKNLFAKNRLRSVVPTGFLTLLSDFGL